MPISNTIVEQILKVVEEAADVILYYYRSNDIKIKEKADQSPVTKADVEASNIIVNKLAELTPKIPVVSEEHKAAKNLKIIQNYNKFWLLDPLDGTWPFIRKRGVFTINLALVENGLPIWGLLYSPLHRACYYTQSTRVIKLVNNERHIIHPFNDNDKSIFDFLLSSKNISPELRNYIDNYQVCTITSATAAYKFCMMADNKGDIYPRMIDTSLWDVAAGHAIINTLGGVVIDFSGNELVYNHGGLNNPNFIAFRLKSFVKNIYTKD